MGVEVASGLLSVKIARVFAKETVSAGFLETWIDRLAFKGEDTEDALMDAA